jgi:tetratricopeptide (TPR) repeat protein
MAENENDIEKDIPEVLEESLNKTEILLEENKKLISNIIMGVVALVVVFFGYKNFVSDPAELEGLNAIWEVQQGFETDGIKNDSIAEEFQGVIDEYGSSSSGNIAQLYLGISLMKSGSFDEAKEALEEFSPSGLVMPGLKLGLIGDCQSENEEVEEAVGNYKKAAELLNSKSGSVFFLKKAGVLLEQNGQASEAVEIYETALSKYLKGADRTYAKEKTEMEKYLARAQASK